MFFVARVTSVEIEDDEENIFGVGDGLQEFFNTGLLGAVFLTIVGSISWQLVASAFPIAFLSNPITYILLRICLGLEATGICQGAWVIAAVHRKISGFQRDEVYIGTAEERAKQEMGDNDAPITNSNISKLPGFGENAPASLKKLLSRDKSVKKYLDDIAEKMDSV